MTEETAKTETNANQPLSYSNAERQLVHTKMCKPIFVRANTLVKLNYAVLADTHWVSLEAEVTCPYFCSEINLTVREG